MRRIHRAKNISKLPIVFMRLPVFKSKGRTSPSQIVHLVHENFQNDDWQHQRSLCGRKYDSSNEKLYYQIHNAVEFHKADAHVPVQIEPNNTIDFNDEPDKRPTTLVLCKRCAKKAVKLGLLKAVSEFV